MAIEICPLAADWGTWGDWFSGIASVVLGLAVLVMTARTNDLAHASNGIAEKVAEVEANRASAEVDRDLQERRLLLVSIGYVVADAMVDAKFVFTEAEKVDFESRLGDAAYLKRLMDALNTAELKYPDTVYQRLHVVGNPVAAKVMRSMTAHPQLVAVLRATAQGPERFADRRGDLADVIRMWCSDILAAQAAGELAARECELIP